jgi:hypothetical protein
LESRDGKRSENVTMQTEDTGIETAVEVLEDFLHLVEPEKRLEVLTRAVAKEEAAGKKREEWRSGLPEVLKLGFPVSGVQTM